MHRGPMMTPSSTPEVPSAKHREARRHTLDTTGRLRLPELLEWVDIDVANVSVEGALLQSAVLLDVGARFAIQIPLPDGSRYRGHAEVVRHAADKGMGVRFLHLSDLDRRRLRRILGV